MHSKGDADGSLAARVEKLEHQNRRLRQAAAGAIILWIALFTMAQMRALRPMEAAKFLLVDAKGKKRAELGLVLDRPMLAFYDESGAPVLKLGLEKGEAAMSIGASGTSRRAVLGVASGSPQLTFHGDDGQRRLWVGLAGETAALGLVGAGGEARAALGMAAGGNPYFQLFGEHERGGLQLAVAEDLTVLRFLDASDRPRAVFGLLEKERSPGLVLNDGDGKARAILMLTPAGPGFEFLDEKRARVWHAP